MRIGHYGKLEDMVQMQNAGLRPCWAGVISGLGCIRRGEPILRMHGRNMRETGSAERVLYCLLH